MIRTSEESWFNSSDGTPLFYRHWPAVDVAAKGAILLLHRGHEHSGRMAHLADELKMPDYAMFAWDARGHGRSEDRPDSSPTLGTFVQDLDAFARHVCDSYGFPMQNIAIVAQSVGSVLAAAWAHDYAPKIRGMVLGSPAFKVKLYVPFARTGLAALHAVRGDFHVNSYVKARFLTHDPERIASYESDPLIKRPISVKVLLGLYSAADRVVEDAQAIQVPTQLLISGSDWVVHHKPQHDFFDRLGTQVKEKHVFDGFYHDTLGEKDRHLALDKARDFLLRLFAEPPTRPSLLDAHRRGFTKAEYDTMSKPLPALSLKGINFALTRLSMSTGGRISDGIRLGLETGFDSGSTLDYVYRNKPAGITPLGRIVDWFYINSIGWRGIRVRKKNVEQLLARSVKRLRQAGMPVRIMDVAAGHGRYVLDALNNNGTRADAVLLRDYSDINVRQGSELIRARGLEGLARFEQGDAFDRKSLASVNPRPTIGVVSGLYELFPDNDQIRTSLSGIADAMEPGGYLVYTGQPWHPQLEMIARVLPSHRNHQPWVMRRRTQAEMDQLVESAGFRKVEQLTDEWGIFTVSVAQRVTQ